MYEPKNFDHLLGTPGFSDQLLQNHFTLYQGYVKNVNTMLQDLDALVKEGKAGTQAYAEIKRRFGWEWNGVRLHELYFGNMAKTGTSFADGVLKTELMRTYGSFEQWEKDFRAVSAMRGIGWAVLYFDPVGKQVFNVWVNEHDMGHLAGCTPLLILDVFEHAYMLDYGIKRADYIEAFFKAIDWQVVAGRLAQ
ncbi:superoxide dismutase [Candidatus Parcubacteria bacterium]|nr:MAG: superoxide dismutase [Candidatus Parcubacteria bacterium]